MSHQNETRAREVSLFLQRGRLHSAMLEIERGLEEGRIASPMDPEDLLQRMRTHLGCQDLTDSYLVKAAILWQKTRFAVDPEQLNHSQSLH